jgi:hypothetical protein
MNTVFICILEKYYGQDKHTKLYEHLKSEPRDENNFELLVNIH